jgi:hypothetical protein
MDGVVKTAPGHSPKARGPGILSVDFGTVAAGTHALSCTVDSRNQVAETNENNNSMSAQVAVLLPDYDLAITAIGSTVTETLINFVPHTFLGVTLKNNGRSIIFAEVDCALGGLTFKNLMRSGYNPGESRPIDVYSTITTSLSQIPSGPRSVSCTARIVSPSGVTDGNPANNTLTGTVSK